MVFFKKLRLSKDYLLILLCLIFANIPYFAKAFKFYPVHDSMSWLTHFFYVFYNEYFINGQLPLWLPYNMFGMPTDYYLFTIMSPAQYFAAFAGKIFGIKNALTVLNASMFLEQLAFVTGMYLLSSRFFKHRLSVLFVCIGSVFTIFWGANFGFNFRLYYLMPFVLFFIVKFFNTGQIKYIWLTGIVGIISSIAYFFPVYLLVYSIFFIVLLFANKKQLKVKKQNIFSFQSIAFFLLFALLVFIYSDFLMHIFNQIKCFSTSRDFFGKVSLENFLSHGGLLKDGLYLPGSGIELLWQFIYACPRTYDFTIYIGLIPLVFILYGLLHPQKNPIFKAVSTIGVVVLLLSLGELTFVATTLYLSFPFMSLYRHISYLLVIVKFFFLIMAGFGFDYYLDNNETGHKSKSPVFIAGILTMAILVTDIFIFKGKFAYTRIHGDIITYGFHFIPLFTLVFMILYLVRLPEDTRSRAAKVIVFLYFFEIASFSTALFLGMPIKEPSFWARAAFNVSRYDFSEERAGQEMMYRLRPYSPSAMEYAHINKTPLQFSAFYFDPSVVEVFKDKEMRVDIVPLAIDELFRARFKKDLFNELVDKETSQEALSEMAKDKTFMNSLGISAPKLRIITNPKIVSDMKTAVSLIRSSPDIDISPIICQASAYIRSVDIAGVDKNSPPTSKIAKKRSHASGGWYSIQFQQKIGPTIFPFWESNSDVLGWLLIEQRQKRTGKLMEYKLTADIEPRVSDRMPADWVLQGSNDGKSWVELDRRINEMDWRPGEERAYKISHPSVFKLYRLYVERTNNNIALMRIGLMKIRFDKDERGNSISVTAFNEGFKGHVLPIQKTEFYIGPSVGEVICSNLTVNSLKAVVQVNTKNAYLVYLDSYHPGWKAFINGRPTEIARANIAFKAVALELGRNEVNFEFTGNHHAGLYLKILFLLGIISSLYIIALSLSCLFSASNFKIHPVFWFGILALLACLPLFVFDFGLHNDYGLLLAQKPTKLTFTNILFGYASENPHLIMVGRPINAFLTGLMAINLNNVNDFALMRFISFFLTFLAAWLFYIYLKNRLSLNVRLATAISFGIFALPASQAYLIWVNVLIPGSLTVLVSCISYLIFDWAFIRTFKLYQRILLLIASFIFLFSAFLTYPPNALFFLVFTIARIFFSELKQWPEIRRRAVFDLVFCGVTTLFYYIFTKLILTPLFFRVYPLMRNLMIEPQRYALSISGDLWHKAVQFYDMSLIAFSVWFHAQFDEKIAYPIFFLLLAGVFIIFLKYVLQYQRQIKTDQKSSILCMLKTIFQIIFSVFFIIFFSACPILLAKGSYVSYRLIFPYCAIVLLFIFWVLFNVIEVIFKNQQNLSRAVSLMSLAIIILSVFLAVLNLYSCALSAKKELSFIRQKILYEMPWNTTTIMALKPPWGSSFVEPVIKHEFNYMASNYNNTPIESAVFTKESGRKKELYVINSGKRLLMNDLYKDPYKEFAMDRSFKIIEVEDATFVIDMNEITNNRVVKKYKPKIIKKGTPSEASLFFPKGSVLLRQGYQGFNIIKFGKKYYAILQGEGAFEIEKIKNKSYSKLAEGDSLEDVIAQIETDEKYFIPLLVEEGYKRFNIIKFGKKYYAILQGEGAFEIKRVERSNYSVVFQGATIRDVKRQINALPEESFKVKIVKYWRKIINHLY